MLNMCVALLCLQYLDTAASCIQTHNSGCNVPAQMRGSCYSRGLNFVLVVGLKVVFMCKLALLSQSLLPF